MMKILSFRRLLAGALLTLTLFPAVGRSAAPVPPAEAPAGASKSVFMNQAGFGKDPFFPNSTRLQPKTPVKMPDAMSLKSGVPDFVLLKGFAVLKDRKLAIINNYTVEAGEEFLLKFNGQQIKVKCIMIKDDSVVIEVNGSTKELKLRTGL